MSRVRTVLAIGVTTVLVAACAGGTGSDTTTAAPLATTTTPAHGHEEASGQMEITPELADSLAEMRAGTARYANDLDAALEDGYFMITQMIPDMGYHFLNPAVEGVDMARPPILVYGREGDDWELVAVEWVFPEEPEDSPLEGATYGSFPAACHFEDGLFLPTETEKECAETHSDTGSAFTFWHPDLVTFHTWAWMHNPDGIFNGTNPLMASYNDG